MGREHNTSNKKSFKYDKLGNADDLKTFDEGQYEDDLDADELLAMQAKQDAPKAKSGKRDHEIYNNTYYIPNDKLRLLEIPMNSNLLFQMLLYYHAYFDGLYGFLLIPSGLYKIFVAAPDPLNFAGLGLTVFYCITELFRLNFGYTGNINESFPELIAFII